MATLRGRFVWHDLMTTDTQDATRFYPQITGWSLMPDDPSYQMWAYEGKPLGGLMDLPDEAKSMGAKPNWLPYVGTPSAEATVSQATALGGNVLKDVTSIPTVGRFAVLADPQGAVFAIFMPDDEQPGTDDPPGLGAFSWHELATTDLDAAFRFYQALFGWQKTESMDMGPGGTYLMYGWPGTTLGGIYNKPPEMPAPPHWLCYVTVPSADRGAEQVRALGGTVAVGPMEVPGGDRIAQCLDPQGAAFALHSTAAAQAVPTAPEPAKASTGREAVKKELRTRVAKKTVTRAARKATTKTKAVRKSARGKKAVRSSAKKTARKVVRKARTAGKSARQKATTTAKKAIRKAAKKTRTAGKSVRRKATKTAKKTKATAKKVASRTARKASKRLKSAKKAAGRTARKATKRAKRALRRTAQKAGKRVRALGKAAKKTAKRRLRR